MGRQKKDKYASEDDLAWFKRKNYDSLKTADFGLWATVIRDRVQMAKFLDADKWDNIKALYKTFQLHPLQSIGLGAYEPRNMQLGETSSVKSMTIADLASLPQKSKELGRDMRLDDYLAANRKNMIRRNTAITNEFAHVIVNMRATDEQLLENFKHWLEEKRETSPPVAAGDYEGKVKRWVQARLVPYMDLELFTRVTGKHIDTAKKFHVLLGIGEDECAAQRRRLLELKKNVFTDEMAHAIELLAQHKGQRKKHIFDDAYAQLEQKLDEQRQVVNRE